MKYRIEFDSIGKIKVPGDKYWGASTERSNKYFNIGDFLVRPLVIHSIAIIKKAAAIVNVKNNCFSVQNIRGYTVGSIDTILCFLYSYYLTYLIAKYLVYRHNTVLEDTQQYINLYENMINGLSLNKRLLTTCYGKEISNEDIYLKNWDKKLSILKI